ncbi:MAG: BON domain-containing protein [Hyphomicrobiales bacterium]
MVRRSTLYDVRPGYAVFTRDGNELGRVREVRDNAFKVDIPWRPDRWFPLEAVLSVIPEDRVTLDAGARDLDRIEIDRPAMGPDEYRQRYGGGMDFDPERDRWREGAGYGPYYDYGRGGGTFDWDEAGAAQTRGDEYGRRRGDYRSPESGYDREGQWDSERRRRFTGEGPWSRERTTQQWGQQYQGYAGDRRRGERPWWYQGGRISATEGGAAYGEGSRYGYYGGYAGRGPKGYQRSDDRICEDICEAFTRHPDLDASDIEVSVEQGEASLRGTVETRFDKRLAEDIASGISGVRDVRNELKAQTNSMTGAERPITGRAM